MAAKQIAPGLYELPLGLVNAFLLETDTGLVVIDTGYPNKADAILTAVRALGKQPNAISHIILTHAHPDHIGSLAALKRATNAPTSMHPTDAPIARAGGPFRPLTPSPGMMNYTLFRLVIQPSLNSPVEGTAIDHEVHDGEVLLIAGGLTAIHTPGHCAGHLAFVWPREGVLFAGDTCSNVVGLGLSVGYEDSELGKRSLAKLAELDFDTACFGHGKTIQHGAARQFRQKWL